MRLEQGLVQRHLGMLPAMATLTDPGAQALLTGRNHAVVSTHRADGSIHSAIAWISFEDGVLAVNSAVGRAWPSNLERDPRVTVLVYDMTNPYAYLEVQGTASGSTEGADAHIDRLAKKYLDVDSYPGHQEGEQRISYVITAQRVRLQG